MTEPTLGVWLRLERERRGITLKTVADQTKVAAPLLAGLESGNLSRWPGGIYRRAFVKAYASALGLDAGDVVRRFEQEHPPSDPPEPAVHDTSAAAAPFPAPAPSGWSLDTSHLPVLPPRRARLIGTAADLTVALVLGLGSAAAGSRLLWPVLLIAGYYAIGVLLKGTSPMVALLTDEAPMPSLRSDEDSDEAPRSANPRPQTERRHPARRSGNRPARSGRNTRARLQ